MEEPHFHVTLDAVQLKLTHTALKSLLDDYGHEEREIQDVIREVLEKLPSEHDMRAIDLDRALARRRDG